MWQTVYFGPTLKTSRNFGVAVEKGGRIEDYISQGVLGPLCSRLDFQSLMMSIKSRYRRLVRFFKTRTTPNASMFSADCRHFQH